MQKLRAQQSQRNKSFTAIQLQLNGNNDPPSLNLVSKKVMMLAEQNVSSQSKNRAIITAISHFYEFQFQSVKIGTREMVAPSNGFQIGEVGFDPPPVGEPVFLVIG